jgi:aspartate/methionine/tyrosine aminotransferase
MGGGKPVFYPLWERNQFMPDPADILDRITKKTKIIIVNSPSNPLGSLIDKQYLKAIANIAQENDLLVVTDEAYERIVYDGLKHHSIGSFPDMKQRTISVFSCSKTYAMTGWRLGYLVGNKTVIKAMRKLQEHIYSHPSSISQRAAVTALMESEDFVKATVKEYSKRRELIVKMLNEIIGVCCLKPEGAFYVFPNVKAFGMTSKDLTNYLIKEAKIAVVPGSEFGSHGEGYLRISYALSRNMIEEGIGRMEKALRKLDQR